MSQPEQQDKASREWEELLNKKEELHPDLQPYLQPVRGVPWLRHPLVYSPFHAPVLNAIINRSYEVKKKAVEEALEERHYSSYIWYHERPYRWNALDNIAGDCDDKLYWELVRSVWTDSENIWACRDIIEGLLEDSERDLSVRSEYLMNEDDRAVLAALPETVVIYRGCGHHNRDGFSWSLDKEQAKWFGLRLRDEGLLLTAHVLRDNIIAYFSDRNEQEIVVNPCDAQVVEEQELRRTERTS